MSRAVSLAMLVLSTLNFCVSARAKPPSRSGEPKEITNSLGMKLVRIDAGSFRMGCLNPTPLAKLRSGFESGHHEYLPNGDWDEQPVHKVTISRAFYMSETEVTLSQFRAFRPKFKGSEQYVPYVSNISWNDAKAFCEWLSEKEGKPYRLPSEAEWEYACRAGTETWFWSGEKVPKAGAANAWGLKNMHTAPVEWCMDWHGVYPDTEQIDPVGPSEGLCRVIRGGGLDRVSELYHLRSANRAGFVPYFPSCELLEKSTLGSKAQLPVGFRVVVGAMPATQPLPSTKPFVQQCVNQDTRYATTAPEPNKPYFRKRYLHPVPPENIPKVNRRRAMLLAGLHPGLQDHNHSPGMTVCSNGDVLAVYYSADHDNESAPEVGLIMSRLRFGEEQWDMPDMLIDLLDSNDHAPLLWNDNGTIYLFWGGGRHGVEFKWCTSRDHGSTFSEIKFPVIVGATKGGDAQPVNSAFRDKEGTIYFGCDAGGTMLWASKDNGKTWFDTGGRTGARHTTFALLGDGSIIGMGGKNGIAEGFNPKSVSCDKGKTWEISGSGFPFLSSNQRPSLIRLSSGRLLYATDFQNKWADEEQVDKSQRGAWLAYSEDQGETWILKKLGGAEPHEQAHVARKAGGACTIGYSVLRQGPNGLIHLVTSVNHPDLHFAFNETWLLEGPQEPVQLPEEPPAGKMTQVRQYLLRYPSGRIKAVCRGGIADDGRYLLDGAQMWFHENGCVKWKVAYDKGRKIGNETYFTDGEQKIWSWTHEDDGTNIRTHWWPNGKKKSESKWRNFKCQGIARRWDRDGQLIDQLRFVDGMPSESPPTFKVTGVTYPD